MFLSKKQLRRSNNISNFKVTASVCRYLEPCLPNAKKCISNIPENYGYCSPNLDILLCQYFIMFFFNSNLRFAVYFIQMNYSS